MPRLLFVLKQRQGYWGSYDLSSGLLNSVTFIVDMLTANGVDARMVQVVDNNFIDAEIRKHKPTHVIIEAFWMVPEKFDVLRALHPHISWSVRNHSEMPFLANEGIALDFIYGYLCRGIEIMSNAPRAVADLQAIAGAFGGMGPLISYAPNVYPIGPPCASLCPSIKPADDIVRVGCFGAVRPLKNHLVQAVAAIRFADFLGRKLEFHVNAMRVEGGGEQIVKNLRSLFKHTRGAKLVEHPWLSHADFLTLLRTMDFAQQVSFSETFNIVAADAVRAGVPVTASEEVVWLGKYAYADPNSSTAIMENMISANRQIRHHPQNNRLLWQWRDLHAYSQRSQAWWVGRFGNR